MRAKILIIDSDVKEASTLQHILETEGHKVKKVHSAETAVKAVIDEDYDLAYINIEVKDILGADLIRMLRQPLA